MADLPEWVLKYKAKGVYVNRTKNGYRLFRGHSERVPGKRYPVLRCDEYLGMVTEKEGLVAPRPPVRAGIRVLRYGFFLLVGQMCGAVRNPSAVKGGDPELLVVRAVLGEEGFETQAGYEGSWISQVFPGKEIARDIGHDDGFVLERLRLQVSTRLTDVLGADRDEAVGLAGNVYAVWVNGGWHVSDVPERLRELSVRHGLELTGKEGIWK